jgi:hypothetical protein
MLSSFGFASTPVSRSSNHGFYANPPNKLAKIKAFSLAPAVVDSVPAPLYRAAIISQQVSAIGFNCSRRMDEFCETLLPCASQRDV